MSASTFRSFGFQNLGFRKDGIATNDVSWESFLMNLGVELRKIEALGIVFSDFLSLKNRLKNRGIFGDVTDPEFWFWRGASGDADT